MPDQKVRETLQRMGRAPEQPEFPSLWFGDALAVEHRYASDLAHATRGNGVLTLNYGLPYPGQRRDQN